MAKQSFSVGQVLTAAQMTSLQQTAMLGGAASSKTASYTLVAADAGTAISMTSTSATTVTVNTALFAAGDTVQITNLGTGVCTITAGTATVNTSSSLALAQYESGTLDFTSTSSAIFIKGAGAVAAGGSMTVLASGTFSNNASVVISSISGAYRDLKLRISNYRPSFDGEQLYMRFNGDTGNNYYATISIQDTSLGAQNRIMIVYSTDNTASAKGIAETDIINYSSSTTNKLTKTSTLSSNTSTPANRNTLIQIGEYNSATAITSITLLTGTDNITSGSYELLGVN